jgi:predicted RNA methylase
MCTIKDFEWLVMTPDLRENLVAELEQWHAQYLPVSGTVLDLGAGCGETALFYLNHGATQVICIEGDPRASSCLKQNFGNDSRVTIVPHYVSSIKVDIEGWEKGMVVEVHGKLKWKKIADISRQENVTLWKLE